MEWNIRESYHGDVVAEYGIRIEGGTEARYKPGYFMPAFIPYYISHFKTRKQAERFVKDNPNPLKRKVKIR